MNRETAISILNLPNNFTKQELKHAFRIMALKYHPDKSKTNTEEYFIQIHDAYKFLSNDNQNYTYNDLVKDFLKSIHLDYSKIMDILSKFYILQIDSSVALFKNLNEETAINILIILTKYRDLFKLTDSFLEILSNTLDEKIKNKKLFIIRPKSEDMYLSNCYKLEYNKKIYYAPMWHEEIYYEDDIIIKCIPDLFNHEMIDENNNYHITIQKNLNDIIVNDILEIIIFNKTFDIKVESLYIRKYQVIILKSKGIPKINENIYDNSLKADILIHLILNY